MSEETPRSAMDLIARSVATVEDGLAKRDLDQMDVGIVRLMEATNTGSLVRDHLFDGLIGRLLELRWQVSARRSDLDAAVRLLLSAAETARRHGDHFASVDNAIELGRMLSRRFRRRRRREDLLLARDILSRRVDETEHVDSDTRDRYRTMVASVEQQLSSPPHLIIETDLGETDSENLVSPHALANLQAWNRGEEMTSGIDWVTEFDPELALLAPSHGPRRILFLRTFAHSETGLDVLRALRLAASPDDVIEVLSDTALEDLSVFNDERAVGNSSTGCRMEVVSTTDSTWRREVVLRIARSDLVCLYLAPSDIDFAEFPFNAPNVLTGSETFEALASAPFAQPLTGRGLLGEISYLSRLDRVQDTVLACDQSYSRTLDELVCLGGIMGNAMTPQGDLVTPRLSAVDKQVGRLRNVRTAVAYQADRGEITVGLLVGLLSSALNVPRDKPPGTSLPWSSIDLIGVSADPRRLPPDGAKKIICYTPVEDVIFLPAGEITQVAAHHMREVLGGSARARGCPHCRAALDRLFFYVTGLHGEVKTEALAGLCPNGRCQECGRKSSMLGDALAPQ